MGLASRLSAAVHYITTVDYLLDMHLYVCCAAPVVGPASRRLHPTQSRWQLCRRLKVLTELLSDGKEGNSSRQEGQQDAQVIPEMAATESFQVRVYSSEGESVSCLC